MKCASLGSSIVDNIRLRDGSRRENISGGMAVYAYSGIRLYTDDALLLTGVGEDYDSYYGGWIERNRVPREGFIVRHRHTMNILLEYDDDRGGYVTRSIYGDDRHRAAHQAALDIGGAELRPFAPEIDWLYLGWNWLEDRPGIDRLREEFGFKIMWETNSRIDESYLPVFRRHLPLCDMWSINRTEAFALFGLSRDEEVIERIMSFQKPCYYRLGVDGACMIDGSEAAFVPMISIHGRDRDIDPTGCGNTSTGAAMWAHAAGFDPLMTGVLAAVAAGYNALQFGLIPDMNAVRGEALERAKREYLSLGGRPEVAEKL